MKELVRDLIKLGMPVFAPKVKTELEVKLVRGGYRRILRYMKNNREYTQYFVCWALDDYMTDISRRVDSAASAFTGVFDGDPVTEWMADREKRIVAVARWADRAGDTEWVGDIIRQWDYAVRRDRRSQMVEFRIEWVRQMRNQFNKQVRESSRAKHKEKCDE